MSADLDKPSSAAIAALTRLLQKHLKRFVSALPKLQKDESAARKDVHSLANFLEQRISLSKAHNIPLLTNFPDVQSKLLVKVSSEIEAKVSKLSTYCDDLQELHTSALKAVGEATALCQKYQQQLSPDVLQTGSATFPPLGVMLGWLVAIERHVREQHCSRREMLVCVARVGVTHDSGMSLQEVVNAENLEQLWTQDFDKLTDVLVDCREQCCYLFEEKI